MGDRVVVLHITSRSGSTSGSHCGHTHPQGTSDPCAWLAVPCSLQLLRALGPHRVAHHNHTLASQAAAALAGALTRAAGPQCTSTSCYLGSVRSVVDNSAGPRGAEPVCGSGKGDSHVSAAVNDVKASGSDSRAGDVVDVAPVVSIVGGDGEGGSAGMLAVSLPPLVQPYSPAGPDAAASLQHWLRGQHCIEVCRGGDGGGV
jgi:hypothetical protein